MGNYLRRNKKYLFLVVDILLIAISYIASFLFRYDLIEFREHIFSIRYTIAVATGVYIAAFLASGVYNCIWFHSGIKDYIKLAAMCSFGMMATSIICILVPDLDNLMSLKVNILSSFLVLFCLVSFRIISTVIVSTLRSYSSKKNHKNLLIIGAGCAAALILNDININRNLNYNVIGLIDDDPFKLHRLIHGYKVIGSRKDIVEICLEKVVDEILIAIPSASEKERQAIISICSETDCKVKIVPSIDQLINSQNNFYGAVRDIQVEDLLSRDLVVLDSHGIASDIANKTILVTGGGGSIGSELCRQIIKFDPKCLIILDIYENNAYTLQNELIRKYPEMDIVVLIASVRDYERLDYIFCKYRPDIVFHAAAHKHVPLMEFNPAEAIKNNVFGTYNTAICADKYKTGKFVMISTDKAVNPTNVMGATKRICEMIVQSMQTVSNTEFVAVRFGNVLGSNGSVIPLFKQQIENGGPVTVTHKDITRFFMTIPEAAQLVIQASCFAKGGEIFVLDMGKPVKIYDLAVNLIKLSGHKPNGDIKIEIVGLRPGEKLYEELLLEEEGLSNTAHSKIFVGKSVFSDISTLKKYLGELKIVLKTNDDKHLKNAIEKIVPTYTMTSNCENEELDTAL